MSFDSPQDSLTSNERCSPRLGLDCQWTCVSICSFLLKALYNTWFRISRIQYLARMQRTFWLLDDPLQPPPWLTPKASFSWRLILHDELIVQITACEEKTVLGKILCYCPVCMCVCVCVCVSLQSCVWVHTTQREDVLCGKTLCLSSRFKIYTHIWSPFVEPTLPQLPLVLM